MAKNGFTTSQEGKRKAGNMLNSDVTSRDIDILHGKCPYFLEGSRKWMRSPAAAVMLGPRIVQKQQAGSIDIMVLKPLGMIFCQALD
jgi:hypothetical protein